MMTAMAMKTHCMLGVCEHVRSAYSVALGHDKRDPEQGPEEEQQQNDCNPASCRQVFALTAPSLEAQPRLNT